MRWLYTVAFYLLTPALVVRLCLRGFRNRAYWSRWGERFGRVPPLPADRPVLWVHAVSVGEVRAADPIVRALRERYPGVRMLVTTMTPTGTAQVQELFGPDVEHCYLPWDYPGALNRFLDRTHPEAGIIMETEIWPNLIAACARRGVPLVFANVRLSEGSAAGYRRIRALVAPALSQVAHFAVQAPAHAERLRRIGAPAERITVTGSVKFDSRVPASLREVAEVVRREWGRERPVFLAGSTRDGEEELILDACDRLRDQLPDLLLVLVPRHPERFATVARLVRSRSLRLVQRSDGPGAVDPGVQVYVGDTMGELQILYAAADVVFVGGSLLPYGGHNILESCAVGVPVVFGPHMFNFEEIAQLVRECGAGRQVSNADALEEVVAHWLGDADERFRVGQAGLALVSENRGALQRTLDVIDRYALDAGAG